MQIKRKYLRLFAWWYLTIALGFLLLAVYRALVGDELWWVLLRVAIAAGFGVLAYYEFRHRGRQ